jgi:TM2 domain-containing membrane protein YozV
MTSVIKSITFFLLITIGTNLLFAQNIFDIQFDYAKKLFEDENYFDAVTEFKRLLFFDETQTYEFDANFLIGLSYKHGGMFSEALQYLSLAKLKSGSDEEFYTSSIEIIKINILRRTTFKAFSMLDSLANDRRFKDKLIEINYWKAWTYIFSDDWEKASEIFTKNNQNQMAVLCDSINNNLYNPQLAKYLSIIPGAGQFYTGEYVSGLLSIGWNVLWGYLTIDAFIDDRVLDGVLIGSLLWLRFYSGNIQNAEKFAVEKNLHITNSALLYLQNNYSGDKP